MGNYILGQDKRNKNSIITYDQIWKRRAFFYIPKTAKLRLGDPLSRSYQKLRVCIEVEEKNERKKIVYINVIGVNSNGMRK